MHKLRNEYALKNIFITGVSGLTLNPKRPGSSTPPPATFFSRQLQNIVLYFRVIQGNGITLINEVKPIIVISPWKYKIDKTMNCRDSLKHSTRDYFCDGGVSQVTGSEIHVGSEWFLLAWKFTARYVEALNQYSYKSAQNLAFDQLSHGLHYLYLSFIISCQCVAGLDVHFYPGMPRASTLTVLYRRFVASNQIELKSNRITPEERYDTSTYSSTFFNGATCMYGTFLWF